MQLKKSQILVTPKKAEEFLKYNTYAGQRNKSPAHIRELAAKMTDGRFHNGQIATVNNGSVFLADGQHQCEAVIVSGQKVPATMLEFFVDKGDTKEDVARIFAQFNVDRSRSRGDIAWIYGCNIGMADWPRQCVTLCNTALGWIASGHGSAGGKTALDRDANARLLSAKKSSCSFVRQVIYGEKQSTDAKHLLRAAVAAAMIVTHTKAASDAEVFWMAVRDGDMLKRSDPAFALREFLRGAACSYGGGHRSERDAVSAREMYARCVHGWNAYRQKQSTALRYYPSKPLPKVV